MKMINKHKHPAQNEVKMDLNKSQKHAYSLQFQLDSNGISTLARTDLTNSYACVTYIIHIK